MRYEEPDNPYEPPASEQGVVKPYISDQTAFMRWSTEIEPDRNIVDDEFIKRYLPMILDNNKFLSLSNIQNPRSIKLYHLRRNLMRMAWDNGLVDTAIETALSNVADYNTTRGQNGFYQKALITQRREWEDKTQEQKKQGLFSRLIGGSREKERAVMITGQEEGGFQ